MQSKVAGELKPAAGEMDWRALQTGSMGVLSPVRSLLQDADDGAGNTDGVQDPGFELVATSDDEEDFNFADQILGHFAIRATVRLTRGRLTIKVFVADAKKPHLTISDTYDRSIGDVRADLRFFPRREGLFAGGGFDGRRAYSWIRANAGVKVFDRSFQMRPYGMPGDDWLGLPASSTCSSRARTARSASERGPRSASSSSRS